MHKSVLTAMVAAALLAGCANQRFKDGLNNSSPRAVASR
jgi:uncharacterized lipoprotein YajG